MAHEALRAQARRRRAPATAFSASARISGASLSRNGSGRRKRARSAGAGPGRRPRGSTTSIVPEASVCPAPSRSAGSRPGEAVDAEPEPRDRGRVVDAPGRPGHDGRRLEQVGLDRAGDGEGLGLLLRLAHDEEAHGALLAHDLAHVRDPRARRDAGEPALHPEGRHRAARRPRTTSRAWTSSVIGALRRVAGSKTRDLAGSGPVSRPRAARARARFRESAGGSASSRVSRRSPEGVRMVRSRRRPSRTPSTSVGPVPGSRENEKRCEVEGAVHGRLAA